MDMSYLYLKVRGDHLEANVAGSDEVGIIGLGENHETIKYKIAHL